MAANDVPQFLNYLEDDIYESTNDVESIASRESDDNQDHSAERVLAQVKGRTGTWYLVKWKDCPVIRSSWEGEDIFENYPWVLDAWYIEQQRQAEGLSKPLDLVAFDEAVFDADVAQSRRRALRRLKRRLNRVLSIAAN
ncbi:hypothetical protein BJ875DRAFT_525467 [Amylocarpus encephaloides]|uniref:Chromo domain-containing protein n=1 Tax=Amylocarpus encephaloides TaxID=45428 RepID=A0A9P7Y8W0_9HELO|nr:hypothetical protein BJ875DRAFT_525467 [Amylocarpus encephaloides]